MLKAGLIMFWTHCHWLSVCIRTQKDLYSASMKSYQYRNFDISENIPLKIIEGPMLLIIPLMHLVWNVF